MNVQRKLTLVVATGAMAFGAGHFVQNRAADRMALAAPLVVSGIEPLAAGPDAPILAPIVPVTTSVASMPALFAAPAVLPPPVIQAAADPMKAPLEEPVVSADPEAAVLDCLRQLNLMVQPGAMIGLTLLAPCNPNERIVLRHAGLAVTGQTSPSGAFFATLPALTAVSDVQVVFGSGDIASASIDMPEATKLHRFGVQWQADDAFQLNAFEDGADYDQPGHISAAFTGTPSDGAFLTILGDSTTDTPLLAEVYTYGADAKADIVVEAAVTAGTCGREILGETISAADGSVEITDLTLAMPDCDAIGDILVLKNPEQDMTLAAAN